MIVGKHPGGRICVRLQPGVSGAWHKTTYLLEEFLMLSQ